MPSKSLALAGVLTATALSTTHVEARNATLDCDQNYSVVRGDTLSRISVRAYGSLLYQPIYTANVATIGTNPDMIHVGQSLYIPCLSASTGNVSTPVKVQQASAVPVPPDTADAAENDAADAMANDQLVFTFSRPSAPPFIINSGIIDEYLADVTRVTEGRVSFVDPEVVNRDHAAQFDLVISGQVDGAYVLNSTIADRHPLLQLPMNPMMGGSAEQTAVSLWRLHDAYLAETGYFSEAELLGFVSSPATHIWREGAAPVLVGEGITEKNQYVVPFFSGLDTRGPAAIRTELAQLLDGYSSPTNEPPTFFMAHGVAVGSGLWDADSTVEVTEVDNGLYTPTFSVILSDAAWAQISPADQDAIRSVSGEALSHRSAAWDTFDNAFRSEMLANGLEPTKADKALLDDLWLSSLPALNTWKNAAEALGIPSTEALNFYLANLRELEDRLIYRGEETYVDQNPFVGAGN